MHTHLVVEVGLECELAVADEAPEAARVEEGVVLERADLVGGVDRLAAPQARVVDVVARAEHHGGRRQHDLAARRGARHRRRRGRRCKDRGEGKGVSWSKSFTNIFFPKQSYSEEVKTESWSGQRQQGSPNQLILALALAKEGRP